MKRTLSIICLVLGTALLICGYDAYHSAASSISRALTGAPTDKALWLVIGGLLAEITGIFGLAADTQ